MKVVDGEGNPVANVPMYLKTDAYGGSANLNLDETDEKGMISHTFTDEDMLVGSDEGSYELLPIKDSGYVCEVPQIIEFEIDEDFVPNISTVDGGDYTGEITLVVKKEGSTEPEKPEVDPKVLNVKVVDEEGNSVEGVELYLQSQEYEGEGDVQLSSTDTSGKMSYTFTGDEYIFGEDEDTYRLLPTEASGYICDAPKVISFEIIDWAPYISTVDGVPYTGEITMEVKSSATKAAKKVKTLANTSGEEQTLTDWIATGEAKEVTAKGDENERTFEVTFPVKNFPEALKWTVGVAFELADVTDKQDVKGNEVDIAAYETERQEALDQLKQAIKDAEEHLATLKEKEYTKESWKAYKDAIKEAKDMVKKNASKDEYLAMIQKLADAKAGLRKVNQPGEIPGGGTGTGGTGTGGNGSGNGNPNAGTGGNGSGAHGNSQKAPQTGDATPLVPLAVSILGALAVILTVAAVKRRAK